MAACNFTGNTDMYGLGIRIGFYLQWYGGIMAAWLAPDEVPNLRLSISLFIAATFLALLIQVIRHESSLQVVEIYIVLLLTFGYYLFLAPLYAWRLIIRCNPALDPSSHPRVPTGPVYSALSFLLLIAVASFELWFWFADVPRLNGQTCQEYGFFFAKIRMNERPFQVLNIVFYMLLLVSCAVILCISVGLRKEWVEERERPLLRQDYITGLQKLQSAINVAVVSTVLIATELTIKWNEIEGVNSLSSAGQTIPLLIGIGAIVRILYVKFFEQGDGIIDRHSGPTPLDRIPVVMTRRPASPAPLDRIPALHDLQEAPRRERHHSRLAPVRLDNFQRSVGNAPRRRSRDR